MNFNNIIFHPTIIDDMNIIPIMNIEGGDTNDMQTPDTLPIIALRNAVLFPETIIPITVGRDKSIKLVRAVYKKDKILGAVAQKDAKNENPNFTDLFEVGTLSKILKIIEMPDGGITIILQGLKRFVIKEMVTDTPYMVATVDYVEDEQPKRNLKELDAICDSIKDSAIQVIKMSPQMPQEAAFAVKNIEGRDFLINFIASSMDLDISIENKVALLKDRNVKQKALKLLEILNKQIDILRIKDDIQQKVRGEIDQQQREYYLNNQLKTIQEELGMNVSLQEFAEIRRVAKNKRWSKEVALIFEKEMMKLEKTNQNSPDFNMQFSYVKFLVDLPWDYMSKDNLDLKHAQKVLDNDHFGLESIKERIIEYLAVLKLKGDMKSPIICLYGPPGVGKTSLGKSIASALGRKYGRISLGGLHDESEIRGHRKTYIGAMPGRVINAINKAGTSNPVIVLDEIDKVTSSLHGDPSSALLEALDPEQNTTFHDNYLDIDYDLSHVLFITTANDPNSIQPALRDRMEMINVTGYIEEEKVNIAKYHLIPKQIKNHGLSKSQMRISSKGVETIIGEYTRESGVRGLEKQLAKIARTVAKQIAKEETPYKIIGENEVRKILGLATNQKNIQKGNEGIGVVTGLAWTQNGGEILFIESSLSDGKGALTSTGNLGDVMKESSILAYQYLKANYKLLDISAEEFQNQEVHIHVPEGAIPKDGPSAGITMVCSIASSFKKRAVKSGIAMTGEITLRGRVLPVGGIKEKILAAKRAGISEIILSDQNKKDIEEIPEIYLNGLIFKYVKTIPEVFEYIF